MDINTIVKHVGKVPHMIPEQGKLIYELILKNDISNIVELGFAHGTSSCYMAAALDEKGQGSITTIDNQSAKERKPNIDDLIEKTGLGKYINPVYANKSYNWELMKLIEKQTKDGVCEPLYDFCYLDGAHNFEIDCAAFVLVDKLLKPGAYILFDDLNWSYAGSPALKDTDWVKAMPQDERETAQIKKLVELVVSQNPNYTDFNIMGEWFMAKKKDTGAEKQEAAVILESYRPETTFKQDFKALYKKAFSRKK